MNSKDSAQAGLAQIKEAVLAHLAAHPEGSTNADVGHALGLESDFEGEQGGYLSWSILGLLVNEQKVRYERKGKKGRIYFCF
ncbi:MAG TPA: hypothetical protein VG936_12500 [Lacunisphaera sp.]|nr:hypothetical protein [Lacunisphaera sp.]